MKKIFSIFFLATILSLFTNCSNVLSLNSSLGDLEDDLLPGIEENDPGYGLWKPSDKVFVFDRGFGTDTYVPRCVPNSYSNCKYGTLSQYDTIKVGETWSMRIPHNITQSSIYRIQVARAETGEVLNDYDLSISITPGDFTGPAPECKSMNRGGSSRLNIVMESDANGIYCALKADTAYYFNLRPAKGTPSENYCGQGINNACRVRVTWNIPML